MYGRFVNKFVFNVASVCNDIYVHKHNVKGVNDVTVYSSNVIII